MKIKNALVAVTAILTLSPFSFAQSGSQCDWWGRSTYPVCEKTSEGWGEENGKKCISRNTCINDQPANRGGIIEDNSEPAKKAAAPSSTSKKGPVGFSFSVYEGGKVNVNKTVDIAYGANGQFNYLRKQSTNANCDNESFGGDPIKGVRKACYIKTVNEIPADQCNSTNQCQAAHGNKATDCANSQSNTSICMCGSSRCDGQAVAASEPKPKPTEKKPSASKKCTLAKPAKGLPNFSLFTVIRKKTERKKFCEVKKWYDEADRKQVFKLFKGDNFKTHNPKGRSHARTEAQTPSFTAGKKWHEVEMTMNVSAAPIEKQFTLGQIFANCKGPLLRLAMTGNGRLEVGSVGGSDKTTTKGNYINKSFDVKLRSNGNIVELYINGKQYWSDKANPKRTHCSNGKRSRIHFRWGLYSNTSPVRDATNTVTNAVKR